MDLRLNTRLMPIWRPGRFSGDRCNTIAPPCASFDLIAQPWNLTYVSALRWSNYDKHRRCIGGVE
jgi:hypothetical protein